MAEPEGVHLVGSMPLRDSSEVFRTASRILGDHLRRLPDGETGDRDTWIAWQTKVFAAHPAFEVEEPPPGQYAPLPRFRLRDRGVAPSIDRLGYSDAARSSYAEFRRLKDEGIVAERIRFLVALPTPLAPVSQFISADDKPVVEPAYEKALLRELAEIVEAVPHEELSIQWDIAVELGLWEELGGVFFSPWFDDPKRGMIERIARAAQAVPDDVECGFHLCYGDFGHEHFVQPRDAGNLVEIANALGEAVARRIDWIHLPVPRGRSDDEYFAPLRELRLRPETELYLGLVHFTDGLEGTRRRIEAAQRFVPAFGVATECGLGRRQPETIEPLLQLHADVAARV
jgi:hypothetical protein